MVEMQRITSRDDINGAFGCARAVVFKHSTRCPVSAGAKRHVEAFAASCNEAVSLFQVDVIADRGLSDEIARMTGIIHHSPQVMFVKDGEVTGSITHWSITEEAIREGICGP